MKMNLAKKIDFYLGIPILCFLALVRRIEKKFYLNEPTEIKKILAIKFLGIGSIALTGPALDAVKDKFPLSKIYFLSFVGNREIIEIMDKTERNFFVDNRSIWSFLLSTIKTTLLLRAEKIDLAVDFEFFAKFPLIVSVLAGIKKNAGFYLTAEPWRKYALDYRGYYNNYYHVKDIFLSLVYLIRESDPYYLKFKKYIDSYPLKKIAVLDSKKELLKKKLKNNGWQEGKKIILINPNASPDLAPNLRKWPEERFSNLAEQILNFDTDTLVMFTGSASEKKYVGKITSLMPERFSKRTINLSGQLSLKELISLFSIASVFVTIDSGPMHIASLTDIPIVALFFADTPVLYAPLAEKKEILFADFYSLPSYTVYTGKDPIVSENITARTVSCSEVFEATKKFL